MRRFLVASFAVATMLVGSAERSTVTVGLPARQAWARVVVTVVIIGEVTTGTVAVAMALVRVMAIMVPITAATAILAAITTIRSTPRMKSFPPRRSSYRAGRAGWWSVR